jgi:tRNA U55 pseudouridine synthase TruB
VIREAPIPPLDEPTVRERLAAFKGVRMQAPPKFSAVKHKGKPLYRYAREGVEVEVKERPTRIDGIELLELRPDEVRVRIECGRGTYARVLADEIGEALGTAGHLSALRRTRSGPFGEDAAVPLETISEVVAGRSDWQAVLRPSRARGTRSSPVSPRSSSRPSRCSRTSRASRWTPTPSAASPAARRLARPRRRLASGTTSSPCAATCSSPC